MSMKKGLKGMKGCCQSQHSRKDWWASLVAQWLRTNKQKNLPASAGDTGLIPDGEDPTCCEATKPLCHNYRACALELTLHNY